MVKRAIGAILLALAVSTIGLAQSKLEFKDGKWVAKSDAPTSSGQTIAPPQAIAPKTSVLAQYTPTGKLEIMIGSGQVLPAFGTMVYVLPQAQYSPLMFDAVDKLARALRAARAGNNYSGPTEYGCKKTVLELHQALLQNVQKLNDAGSPSAQVMTVDDTGVFKLGGMPPGAYLFVAEGDVGRNTLLWLKNVNVSDFASASPVIDFGPPQISCFYVPGF
jgi:hypothetical protein